MALLVHQLLGELSAAPLAEDGALGVELHAAFEVLLGRAVLHRIDLLNQFRL
jgi:hypothetical protein